MAQEEPQKTHHLPHITTRLRMEFQVGAHESRMAPPNHGGWADDTERGKGGVRQPPALYYQLVGLIHTAWQGQETAQ